MSFSQSWGCADKVADSDAHPTQRADKKGALSGIAREALKRNSGARGLRAILENSMLDIMYEVPYLPGIVECLITEDVILKPFHFEVLVARIERRREGWPFRR